VDVGTSLRAEGRNVLTPIPPPLEQGVVTPIDPLGRRVVFLVTSVRGRGVIYDVVLSDVDGVLKLERLETRRRHTKNFIRELRERAQGGTVVVPGAAVRALIRQAHEIPGTGLQEGVDPVLVRELAAGSEGGTPGETLRERLAEQISDLPASEAEAVLQERTQSGDLPAWPLTGESLEEIVEKLGEVESGRLILSQTLKRERSEGVLSDLADRILTRDVRERMARRLEETAVFLNEKQDGEGANAALRVAERIRTASKPLDVDYLRGLLERSCDLARCQKNEEDSGKLIVPG
jgi:hypothetical protein